MNDADFHHRRRSSSGLATGLVIIAIGVFFLLNNLGVELPFVRYHNWWALFILIAAIGPIGQAVQHYRTSGRLDSTVIRHLLSATTIIVVALLFLLDLRWDLWWPVFLIIGGCWVLLKRPESSESSD
jgi:hypothetical protein